MSNLIKKFNPVDMAASDVLRLATGREELLQTMLNEMKQCLKPRGNQHFVLFGPRGIGKTFFTRLLKINHDQSNDFQNSMFIQLPEEQDNITYVADLLDFISIVLEGGKYEDVKPRWSIDAFQWEASIKRLKAALVKIKLERNIQHLFITQENLQVFIPRFDKIESARMRSFLSDFDNVTLIGSSLRPDLDNDYNKRLFQVFKKFNIEPWTGTEFLEYYQKKTALSCYKNLQLSIIKKSKYKVKAIAQFTGGSPRLAVILSNLVIEKNILDTAQLLDGIVDELTPYYQDITNDIPHKSKILFDMLIRKGENMTQSALAACFDPPLEQKTIARSFAWLIDNHYVISEKLAKGHSKNFFVRDRVYVLYYHKRQIFADKPNALLEIFVDFLASFYSQQEQKDALDKMEINHILREPIQHFLGEKLYPKIDTPLMIVNDPSNETNSKNNLFEKEKLASKLNASNATIQLFTDAFDFCFQNKNWSIIHEFLSEHENKSALSGLLGLVLAESIQKREPSEQLYFYNCAMTEIQKNHRMDYLKLYSALFPCLFTDKKNAIIIQHLTDEIERKHQDSYITRFIIQANNFMLKPKEYDFNALHPEVRAMVLGVMETKR